MSEETKIQWCDSTANPIMGCGGCELFPNPDEILNAIDDSLIAEGVTRWKPGHAARHFKQVLEEAWKQLSSAIGKPGVGHINAVTSTNIYHLRNQFAKSIAEKYGKEAGKIAKATIERKIKCYAAKLHLNRGYSIENPNRKVHRGYAPTFEQIERYPGRLAETAKLEDLKGSERPAKPWLNGLPRMVFVSDMGDAFTSKEDFEFLEKETSAIQSPAGQRHLWLWLTKRPNIMRQFARRLGGFPANVCAMTTVTAKNQLKRVDALRKVDAPVRGLSIEPLWESVASKIDLTGIDWVIVGGESGAKANVEPFDLEWAIELRDLCHKQGVAFFVKQLGKVAIHNGELLELTDEHGGNWDEWPDELRVREVPDYFHTYTGSFQPAAE